MKVKLLSLLLSAAILSTVLAACGSPASTSGTSAPTGSSAATTPIGTGPGYEYIASLPKLSEEKVSFTVVTSQEVNQKDWNEMEFFKALEAATNVHIDFQCFPVASYNDQKNLLLAGGEYPDAFMGYMALTMNDLNQYGPLGVFHPVDDLIAEYCPNYQARLEEMPVLDGMSTAFDGNKYSWGTVNESPSRDFPDNLYINKTWLDNLGLEVPETIDEYYEVLKAFKEQDANMDGDPNNEIPYTFLPFHHINGYGSFFGAFGEAESFNGANSTIYDHFVVKDDETLYLPLTEEYKTAIVELRRFFQDGLFDIEGFVQSSEQYNAKLTSTTPIVGSAYTWGANSFGVQNADQYIAIKPLKASADSEDARVHKRQNHISVQPTGFSITTKCEHPEILAQWVDLFYSETMSILAYYGPENIISIDENGSFTFNEEMTEEGLNFSMQASQNAPYDGAPKFLTNDILSTKAVLTENPDTKMDAIEQYYLDAPASLSLPTINFTAEENEYLSSYGLAIQTYVMQTQSEWLLGKSDIEADWDAYLAQLDSLDVDDFIATIQNAYNRTIGA